MDILAEPRKAKLLNKKVSLSHYFEDALKIYMVLNLQRHD